MSELDILQVGASAILAELGKRIIRLTGTAAPNAGAGVMAPLGSVYYKLDGNDIESTWKKTGPLDTDWTEETAGGGSGLKGAWNVTPVVTPASYTPPNYETPTNVSLLGNVITTDLQSLTPELSAKWKVGGVFIDPVFNLATGPASSYRVQFKTTNMPLTPNNAIFCLVVDTSVSSIVDIETLINDVMMGGSASAIGNVYSLAVMQFDGSNVMTSQSISADTNDGGVAADATGIAPIVGENLINVYNSFFDAAALGAPGQMALANLVTFNTAGPAPSSFAIGTSTVPANDLKVFIGYAAFDDGLGGGVTENDISFTVDFEGAPTTIPVAWTGAPLTQGQMDALLNAPVAAFGNNVPESVAQVDTLPAGAAVNDLYIATVDPGFTANESTIKPFGTFVRHNEIVRITNITAPNEAIDVVNIWRNEGGVLDVQAIDVSVANLTLPVDEPSDSTYATVTETSPGVYELKANFQAPQQNLNSQVFLNYTFTYGESPLRLELNPKLVSTAVTDGPHKVVASKPGFNSGNTGESEITLLMQDYTFTGTSPPNPSAAFNQGKVAILGNAAIDDDTRIMGVYYKVYTDGVTGLVGGESQFGGWVGYVDDVNFVTYISSTMQFAGTNQPPLGPWNPVNSVNITGVDLVLRLNKPLVGNIDGNSNTDLVISTVSYIGAAIQATPPATGGLGEITQEGLEAFIALNQTPPPGDSYVIYVVPYLVVGGLATQPANGNLNQNRPFNYSTFYFWLFKANSGNLQYAHNGYVVPKLVDGYEVLPESNFAIEFKSDDIVLRYINTNNDEVTVSLVTDLETGSSTNKIYFNSNLVKPAGPYPAQLFISPTFSISGQLDISDIDVGLAWFATNDYTVYGINTTPPIIYTRGVDFEVTGVNEITLYTEPPSTPGSLELYYDKAGTGLFLRSAEYIPSTLENITTFLTGAGQNISYSTVTLSNQQVDLRLDTFTRPNPGAIQRFSVNDQVFTPTRGELFTVDEKFDPTLGQPMQYQINNALALVTKDGTYNGHSFIAGNYARWDGDNGTVPFPKIPPVDVATLELKKSFFNFAANTQTSVSIGLASEGVVYYTTDDTFYEIDIDMGAIQTNANLTYGFTFYVMKLTDNETIYFANMPSGITEADIQLPNQIYAITYISASEGWKVFGPKRPDKTTEDFTITLTGSNVDDITRFGTFKNAMTAIYNKLTTAENSIATLIVDGQFTVEADPFFLNFNDVFTRRVRIVGRHGANCGLLFNLFDIFSGWDSIMFGNSGYFNNFAPFLEDIYIQTSTVGVDVLGNQAARSAFWMSFDQTWVIGDNVTFYDDVSNGSNPGNAGAVGVQSNLTIKAGHHLRLIRNNLNNCAPITVASANSVVTILGHKVDATGSTHVPILGPDPVNDTYKLVIKDEITVYDFIDSDFIQDKHFIQGFAYSGVNVPWPTNAAFSAIPNATHFVSNTNGAGVLRVPHAPVIGDTFVVYDTSGTFDNGFGFTVNDFGRNNTTFLNTPAGIPSSNSVVLRQKYGRYLFTYVGSNTWHYSVINQGLDNYKIKEVTSPYNLTVNDSGYILLFHDASACSIIIPESFNNNFPAGFKCKFRNGNSTPGNITITPDIGDSVNNGSSAVTTNPSQLNELYLERYLGVAAEWVATGPGI